MAANFIELQEEVSNEELTDLNQQESTTPDAEETILAQPEEITNEVEIPEKYKGNLLMRLSVCTKKLKSLSVVRHKR
jgi:hypothetical protein